MCVALTFRCSVVSVVTFEVVRHSQEGLRRDDHRVFCRQVTASSLFFRARSRHDLYLVLLLLETVGVVG